MIQVRRVKGLPVAQVRCPVKVAYASLGVALHSEALAVVARDWVAQGTCEIPLRTILGVEQDGTIAIGVGRPGDGIERSETVLEIEYVARVPG